MIDVEKLVEYILDLDEIERVKFIEVMKNKIIKWKERDESELRWMKKLEELGFKK